jgi:Na+/H+ antiporter NhaD/arsenite permease-like protein
MAGIAGKAGVSINFRKFLGRGITVTAVTLAVSTAYVYIRYLM